MAAKYLLSTGAATDKVESYIIDLFKISLTANPSDIPHSPRIGFDFTFVGVTKDALKGEVEFRVKSLIRNISDRFSGMDIKIVTLDLIDEETVNLVISVNSNTTQEFNIDIYNKQR